MRVEVSKSFEKDISKIKDKKLALRLIDIIESLEKCKKVSEIPQIKKLEAKGNYYRIRVGDFRVGIKMENETITLLRFMPRKEIYKYFP